MASASSSVVNRGIDWFSRGRDAFSEGKPCFFDDARLRGDQRQAWYAGWNHQARLNNRSKSTAQDRKSAIEEIQKIRESLRGNAELTHPESKP